MYVVLILYSIAKVGIFLNKSKVNVGMVIFATWHPVSEG